MKAAIFIPYFGSWPEWIDLYFSSLRCNPILDVHFYTDLERPASAPENAIFHKYTFKEYCDAVSKKLKIYFHPDSAYKLCDLKPFYPIIHQDELFEYDYVGFGDIDVVYGSLSNFIDTLYSDQGDIDVFSTHIDRISGHFTLLRNVPEVLNKAFRIPRWKDRLQTNRHFGLDEGDFSLVHFPILNFMARGLQYKHILPKVISDKICQISSFIYPRIHLKELNTTPIPKDGEKWVYDNGSVIDPQGRKLPYLHFLFFKKTQWLPENTDYWKSGFYKLPPPHYTRHYKPCDYQ